jgi:integrase
MARRFDYYLTIGEGEDAVSVGYSPKLRGGFLAVVFVNADGKRVERMTMCKKKDANYHAEAKTILVRAYLKVNPVAQGVTFEAAIERVEQTTADLRPATLVAYRKSVRILLATLAAEDIIPVSPAEITPRLATEFSRLWQAGTFKRGKRSDAPDYKRKPTSLAFYLRQLSALWSHFIDLEYVSDNPWKQVRRPKTDKGRKPVPTEDDVAVCYQWLTTRYPQWERLHALVQLKALSGCRSLDLCQLRSDQLQDGRVVWTADQTKQREGRAVLLPDDLFATLKRLAGAVYLWEDFADDMRRFRASKKKRNAFSPKTVYWVVNNIFREFAEQHPDRKHLTPHALRRRAITLVATATQSVDATAQAIGLNPATARRYYLDSKRAFDSDEVFRKMSAALIPKSPTIPPLNPNNEPQKGTDTNIEPT